eukprot:CAMPEP_0181345244 /NCGR_PEP_ID=MMETSP1101-20121128/32644_1 /TAXON_ID=46948 /ORGANISM="Rhodomonas abbreviata, Strain Caron Lab Isolate" /LENGTH=458 /DNA_ID=CAMNT_0023457183 /DNA_START=136 /DNA_END=1512 /DNA_ORIENTATION=-
MQQTDIFYSADDEQVDLDNEQQDSAADLKFRSIKVETSESAGDFFHDYQGPDPSSYDNVQFGKAGLAGAGMDSVNVLSKSPSSSCASSGCPALPFGTSRTSFVVAHPSSSTPTPPGTAGSADYGTVVRTIHDHLQSGVHAEFDFSFVDHEHMWKGKYLQGSSCYEMDINLYHDKCANTYTIAVRKMKSCCGFNGGSFNTFFQTFKSAMGAESSGSTTTSSSTRKAVCIPNLSKCSAAGAGLVTEEAFIQGVQPIFSMAKSNLESRVQSAKMLCDVAQKDARFLELDSFRSCVMPALEGLMGDESDDVRQYAVMAVSAFAELACYKEDFMRSPILAALFALVKNCCDLQLAYETAQMRRTAAGLALLSRTHPFSVRRELQQQHCNLDAWLQRVDCLHDQRTREAAMVVKSFLVQVSATDLDAANSASSAASAAGGDGSLHTDECDLNLIGECDLGSLVH